MQDQNLWNNSECLLINVYKLFTLINNYYNDKFIKWQENRIEHNNTTNNNGIIQEPERKITWTWLATVLKTINDLNSHK